MFRKTREVDDESCGHVRSHVPHKCMPPRAARTHALTGITDEVLAQTSDTISISLRLSSVGTACVVSNSLVGAFPDMARLITYTSEDFLVAYIGIC